MPGTRVSICTSPAPMMRASSPASSPDSAVIASLGPIPLTLISLSKRLFSRAVRKPNSWMASSRTCVWMRSRTSPPASGSAVKVDTEIVTS